MLHDADEASRTNGEDRDRRAAELAEAILADREFRASFPDIRRWRAQMLVPDRTDRHVGWDAAERARERAEELSDESYRPIKGQLDDIAAELLASPGWQQAAAAGARKKAAEQFLISRADGFFPPAFIRDELYAQAQRLFKNSGSGLF
jgi:hypothetical protein